MTTQQHTHTWKRSKRQHKRPGRIFVECECGEKRQASIVTGSLVVFNTARTFPNGKTIFVSFRLDARRHDKLKRLKSSGITPRKIVEDYLDEH